MLPPPLDADDGVSYLATPDGDRPRLLGPRHRRPSKTTEKAWHLRSGVEIRLSAAGLEELRDSLSAPPGAELWFRPGPAGAFQKLTVQVRDADGATHSYAKIAMRPAAAARLEQEAKALQALSGMRPSVPQLLATGSWQGKAFVQTSAGPSTPGPSSLRPDHVEFVRRLVASSKPLAETSSYRLLLENRDQIASELPVAAAWIERLPDLMGEVVYGWGHGDFTAANTRSWGSGLFVFDWEAANPEVPVGYDLLHFGARPGTARSLPLSRVETHKGLQLAIRSLQGDISATAFCVGWLAHLTLDYANARSHFRPETPGPVWQWITRQWQQIANGKASR